MRLAFIHGYDSRNAGEWPDIAFIRSLAEAFPDCRIDVLARKEGMFRDSLAGIPNITVHEPSGIFPDKSGVIWRMLWLRKKIKSLEPDIVHIMHADGPVGNIRGNGPGLKVIVSVQNLCFLYSPAGFTWLQRHRLSGLVRRSCLISDAIMVHDSRLAAELVKYYFIPKSKIEVVDSVASAMAVYESLSGRKD